MSRKVNKNASYWVQLAHAERQIIEYALECSGGRLNRAAVLLGVSQSFLSERSREVGVVLKRRENNVDDETT